MTLRKFAGFLEFVYLGAAGYLSYHDNYQLATLSLACAIWFKLAKAEK